MVPKQEERRRFPRVNLHTPIRYQLKGESDYDNSVTDDISEGGLSFISDNFIAPLTDLVLEINVLTRIMKAVGRIAWSAKLPHSDRNRMGVEFIEYDPYEKEYLGELLKMLNAEC